MNPLLYLESIQKIPGTTPGEKYKKLNLISRSIIRDESDENPSHIVPGEYEEFKEIPKILEPLVDLEVAKHLRQPEVIAEALKSDDRVLFNRALKVKWFFDGSCKNFTNVEYFMSNIIPYISVHRRYSLLKILSKNLTLNNTELAEQFYDAIAETYNDKQAEPLLMACSETFILDKLQALDLYLSTRQLKQFMLKSPKSLVNYFNLRGSVNFEPKMHTMIRQHAADYVTLVAASNNKHLISPKRTKALLNSGIDLTSLSASFLNNLSSRMLYKKLNRCQFERLVETKFFPDPKHLETHFSLRSIMKFLRYFPADENYKFIIQTFEKLYNQDIFDYDKFITSDMLINILPELRIKYIRRHEKFAKSIWHIEGNKVENFWRCYLPITEAISELQFRIKFSLKAEHRSFLYEALIYACYVNSDKEALLTVLKYLATRTKEKPSVIIPMLLRLKSSFDLCTLTLEHWQYIDKFSIIFPASFIVSKIRSNLIHELPITIAILLYMRKTHLHGPWNLFKDEPHFERKCLHEFGDKLDLVEGVNREYWHSHKYDLCFDFARAVWDFNERNFKAKTNVEMLSITNFKTLNINIDFILRQVYTIPKRQFMKLKRSLKAGEPNLYNYYMREESAVSILHVTEVLKILQRNPDEVIENWEKYFMYTQNISSRARNYFFTKSLWYQDLPCKFANKCLEDIRTNEYCALLAAPSLLHGSVIDDGAGTGLIAKINKDIFWNIIECPKNFCRLNPQPSADTFFQYYQIHYDRVAILINKNCEFLAAHDVKALAQNFLRYGNVNVQKQAIQMIQKTDINCEISAQFSDILNVQPKRIFFQFIYQQARKMLYKYSNECWWLIWSKCLDMITYSDCDIIQDLKKFSIVFPKKYRVDYIKKLLLVFTRLRKSARRIAMTRLFRQLSLLINSKDFPDEYHNEVFRMHLTTMSEFPLIWKLLEKYAVNYVKQESQIIDKRLHAVTSAILEFLKNYWDIPHSKDKTFYPANYLLDFYNNLFIGDVLYKPETEDQICQVLKSLCSVLSPLQIPSCYICLTIRSKMAYKYNVAEFGEKWLSALRSLIEIYSEDSLHMIAYFFYLTYERCMTVLLDFAKILLKLKNDLVNKFVIMLLDIVHLREPDDGLQKRKLAKIVHSLVNNENAYVNARVNLFISDVRLHYED